MLASAALLLTVLASLVGQAGVAQAAPARPAAASSPQAAAGAPAASPDAAAPAGTSEEPPPPAPKAAAQPAPRTDPKADHEAAARSVGQSAPSSACPAALEPDTVVACSVEPYQTVSFALTLPQQKDLVLLQVVAAQGYFSPKLVAPDGTTVTCENTLGAGYGYGVLRCATGQAGVYALQVRDNSGQQTAFSASYVPLLTSPACKAVTAADRKLGAPTVFHGSLPAGSAGDCYTLDLAAGDVLRGYASTYQVVQAVYDATGKELCTSQRDPSSGLDCALTGTAPFRVTIQQSSGTAQEYGFTAARLSRPEGCAVVDPQAFGASPDVTGTARCRVLRAPQAARYTFAPVGAAATPYGGLFSADGTVLLATCGAGACDLTPGDYVWVVEARNTEAGAFGMAFHSAKETRGCVAAGDSGLVSGPVAGTFGGPGQQLCLTLPTASGNGLYLLNRPPAGGTSVGVVVQDAAGTQQCDSNGASYAVCKLTGTAPFRAVLSGTAAEAYQLVVHRTGEAAGCGAWPQSAFGGSWGAEVPLTQAVQQACLSLPADRHSAAEMLDYANLRNQVNASVQLVDPAGTTVCSTAGGSTTTCVLAAGVPYTAMLVGTGWEDTYKLVRRDISQTATCPAPASTTLGGRSTPLDLTSALDARCIRVGGATTDKFWLSSRTLGSRYDPSTLLMAVDADGKVLCRQWGVSCRVTGSTSYVVVVVAAGYTDKPIHTDVDTWKVGTGAGWAPECTAHRISVDGFPLRSGVLDESSTGYCAVIDVVPSQAFTVVGTSSVTGPETPNLSLLSGPKWGDNSYLGYQCLGSYGTFGTRCQTIGGSDAGQAVLLLSAAKTATPVEYSMQGLCDTGCTRPPSQLPAAISPATGAAGTRTQAVVRGSGLTLGTKVRLVRSDTGSGTQPVMTPLSVTPDGTALTVLVDTNGLEPGGYDVVLEGIGYSGGVPSPGYLPKAYTVTAATAAVKSRFVPVTPARFLDTRDGTGATRQRVGPGGVLTLQVAGVKEVPATGVSAIVMNVTAVNPSQAGHVDVYPNGQPVPNVSNLNFAAGQIVPNLVTVPVVNGKVDLRNSSGSVDLIADVTGYYTDAATGSALTPITPSRFLDTRDGTGAPQQRVGPGGVVTLQVAGVKGIPAEGVKAVVMNVTAVHPTEAGHVTVYPNGQPLPNVSNLNFTAGQIVPNLVTVPVVNGKVDLRNSGGSVDLIADVTGYYSATGSTFSSAAPVRLLDTRYGAGARAGKVGSDGIVSLPVAGVEGVPATGVTAVVLNVTVTAPSQESHLTVYPHGGARPGVSNLNFTAGQTVSNLVVVPVVDGRVTISNNWGDADVIADLNGWFEA
ncbi:hypothetical protein OG689_17960 [Kitasatospora sp. NBC_00240]|uniref:hypothetical protein n=1 Tax=Kitasatospora sp. NBC_00240 TaxID=2903567 RepID=UPI0022586306|nr:hypothetical protein [Kitasatospora sp. NBC_00240]MCX5211151.1 hypothetical protein [Kitasatospora sp. NBC_00240]